MKKIIFACIILTTVFTSCDGRKSQRKALSQSIEEFKKTSTFQYNVFKPETLLEKSIDSTLSNGYNVKIKIVTDIAKSVAITSKIDTIRTTTNYRNYKFDISIKKEGKLIFKDNFDKLKANKLFNFKSNIIEESPLNNFDTSSVLQSIVLRDDYLLKNEILIDVIYIIPETDRYIEKTIRIKDNGTIDSFLSNT